MPLDVVRVLGRIEPFPQLGILHRRARPSSPALAFPAVNPRADTLLHVLGIGVEVDTRGTLQRLQSRDGSHQLHAIVGGRSLAAGQLLAMRARDQDGSPSPRSGVSRA